jgi:hypothetical protein
MSFLARGNIIGSFYFCCFDMKTESDFPWNFAFVQNRKLVIFQKRSL